MAVAPPRALVIVSCSRRKHPDPDLLPAIERYDGPLFRLLRRFQRENPADPADIRILSAEFGLIPLTLRIPNYDRRMTEARADELRPGVLGELRRLLAIHHYSAVFICLGRDYQRAILEDHGVPAMGVELRIATGSLGEQLSALHQCLYGKPAALPASADGALRVRAQLRGVTVELTREQIVTDALGALAESTAEHERHRVWYVPIGDRRVPVKWLAGRLTGLPSGAFHTAEARRFLHELGLPVHAEQLHRPAPSASGAGMAGERSEQDGHPC